MRTKRAFTLVELVVAMGVTSLLLALMMMIFSHGSEVWLRSDERLDTFREARTALDLIGRDLAGVVPIPRSPERRDASGRATPDPLERFPLLAFQSHPDGAPEDGLNDEVYAVTFASSRGSAALSAVGYFCAWDEDKSAFVLRRQFTDSDATFGTLSAALKPSGFIENDTFGALFSRASGAGDPLAQHQWIEDVGTYIWDFKFALPADGENGTTKQRPSVFCRDLPQWVEIRFKALGPNAIRKIGSRRLSRETWFDETSEEYRKLILPYEQPFVTRVKLCH